MGLYAFVLLYLVGSSIAATLRGGEREKKESTNDAVQILKKLLKQEKAQSSSQMYAPTLAPGSDLPEDEGDSSPKRNDHSSVIIEEDNGEYSMQKKKKKKKKRKEKKGKKKRKERKILMCQWPLQSPKVQD